ncbi:HAD family phosphatase [Fulvivirga maritima]|uniref:HAD family hydrolase n=1 Tax=Fulvivirga maritima TaxID=2904247 RepID=UPI001F4442C4|nr:HAD family phosphatase [Fulvivirga maritima]UII25142.1 HAD family phosphatase [Fulvivirga maritima]
MREQEIKNIIFDLGGVIINLKPAKTIAAFARLSGLNEEEVAQKYLHDEPFKKYEKGLISDEEFRSYLKNITGCDNDQELDDAWNAMLLDVPQERLELLKDLRKHHKLFLLSNTNDIHLKCFTEILERENNCSIDQFFDHVYYSHQMHKRKPDADIYEQVLNEQQLVPEETLFIDDNADNIDGAANLGIQTIHITGETTIMEVFDEGE